MQGAKINTISRDTIPWRDSTFWEKNFDRDVQLLNCWYNLYKNDHLCCLLETQKIVCFNANKTKYNLIAHNEIETCMAWL